MTGYGVDRQIGRPPNLINQHQPPDSTTGSYVGQSWDTPPSTASSAPVVSVASKARKAAARATSSGSPIRCIGLDAVYWATICAATSLGAPAVYESYEDTLELVAGGESVLVVPASDYRPATHPHLVTVPIADAEPTHVVVASRATDNNPSLDAFRSATAATLAAAA